jgi:hypothetical protein
MDEGPRFFTAEEANALVSSLEIEFGRIARARAELAPVIESLGGAEVAVSILHGAGEPPPGRKRDSERLRALAAEITDAVGRVNDLGCLVKDLDIGLVDFYALHEGEPVFLCWQFGEREVSHWHGVDEGYAARRPLEGMRSRPPSYPN